MKVSKYIQLNHEQIKIDFPDVYKKYEGTHMITAVPGTKPDLRKLNENECVIWGDGESFHFKLTVKKDIRPYLPYYLGCDCVCKSEFPEFERIAKLIGVMYDLNDRHPVKVSCYNEGFKNAFHYQYKFEAVKPILRKLSSMTEDERLELRHFVSKNIAITLDPMSCAKITEWHLSKHFWLFGDDWFDEGLIIESKLAIEKQ